MPWYPIGRSSYPDLLGQMQHVNSERIAQQWLSLVRDFWARFGAMLSPNEGRRPRPRQAQLYAAYLRNGYPVAAYPYTSRHDEVLHGNAIDAGVTRADGSNRALTSEEFAWLHEQCELRGFTWTGRNFGEPWHIEGATRPEHFPPYPGITVDNVLSPVRPAPKPAAITIPREDDDMTAAVKIKETGARFQVGYGTLTYFDNAKDADLVRNVFSASDELHELSLAQAKKLFEKCDIPAAYTDAKALLAAQPNGRWSLQALAVQELRAFIRKGGK
ncbi:hypothetical protein [Curtobacterium sp. MCSS17_015]|uniref:hypothetical protein n=1 Tax=Curtobacterium sp. MCSS17_015 TaxID=2175666 RepID=UPI000DAA39B0|nr:hypothetical protein [Curtobacterium sp. MCSS17_015]WIB25805.1 hypothetical protein DEJ18_12205 [Curtobacterium sp. MCSS17_015]